MARNNKNHSRNQWNQNDIKIQEVVGSLRK